MKAGRIKYGLYLLPLLMMSCGSRSEKPEGYLQWFSNKNHGMEIMREIEPFQFVAHYTNAEAMALAEMKQTSDGVFDRSNFDSLMKDFEGMEYFRVAIKNSQKGGDLISHLSAEGTNVEDLVNYFSFKAQGDINLVSGSDTIACALYHYERGHSLNTFDTMLIGFSKSENKGDRTLILAPKYLKTGPIKFVFEANSLNNIPELDFN